MLKRFVNHEQRLPVHGNVPPVPESGQHGMEMVNVILLAQITLFDQRIAVGETVSEAFPCLVGPRESERKIRFAAGENFVERTLQQALAAAEPIVPVHKAFDAIGARHIGLRLSGFGDSQIVVSQVGRHSRLIMPAIQGFRLAHIGPFGEPFAPPRVIFRNRVVLRQVKCNDSCFHSGISVEGL